MLTPVLQHNQSAVLALLAMLTIQTANLGHLKQTLFYSNCIKITDGYSVNKGQSDLTSSYNAVLKNKMDLKTLEMKNLKVNPNQCLSCKHLSGNPQISFGGMF